MDMKSEVKSKISIPMYFYNIIVPNLPDYYSDYTVDFDVRVVVKCPIHDEDTPSMRYYPETNSFYCFGCGAGGDVIELHRKFTFKLTDRTPSIEESIKFLYDFFIKGNDSASVIKAPEKLIKEEELSTEIDIARFSIYTARLEGQLSVDNSVPEKTKRILWEAIDNCMLLVDKNKAGANDALEYIKKLVRDSIT